MSNPLLKKCSNGLRKIEPLTVKSCSWPSRGEAVWNQQEKGRKARVWRLQITNAPGWMSSLALASSHPKRGKTLTKNQARRGSLVLADNSSSGRHTNNCMGRWCSSALVGKSPRRGYANNYTRNPKVPCQYG